MMFNTSGSTIAAALGSIPSGSAGTGTITVAIYDDHVLARTGLSAVLASTAIEVLDAAPVDLGLVTRRSLHSPADVTLVAAAGQGTELAHRLACDQDAAVLLMLETPADSAGLLAMLATGAAGAVCRECPPGRIITGIRAIASGRGLTGCTHQLAADTPLTPPLLSARERRVAAELARGLHTEDIAEILCISPHTVRTHVRNIKRKLGARTSAQAVALAIAMQAVGPSALV